MATLIKENVFLVVVSSFKRTKKKKEITRQVFLRRSCNFLNNALYIH